MVGYAALLHAVDRDLYYLSVQEDEYVEWASFWAFLAAAGVALVGAFRQRSDTRFPWFFIGLSLFCFVVAMEEISWGQRIIGYRPPAYFLEHNYQQELNLHNVVETQYRKLALQAIILGYGVVLPLLGLIPWVGRLMDRMAVVSPPLAMIPAFLAMWVTYAWYPWKHSGEWVELMLGYGLLAAIAIRASQYGSQPATAGRWRKLTSLAVLWVIVSGLGIATAVASRTQRNALPENLTAVQIEIEHLKQDFQSGKLRTRCNMHKRVYTYVQQYGQTYLREGEFARLVEQGLPEERAEFFLDPWNSPYWIRHQCSSDRRMRSVFVYSFGPNRKRESSRYEIQGDDIGAMISRRVPEN